MSINTVATTPMKVIVSNSLKLAVQCQHHAVRTALQQILDGAPTLALATMQRSVKRCAHLDNRPLSPERVQARADALVREINASASHLMMHALCNKITKETGQ